MIKQFHSNMAQVIIYNSDLMGLTNPFNYSSYIENDKKDWRRRRSLLYSLVAADVTRGLNKMHLGDATMTLSNQRLFDGEISSKSH